MTALLWIGVTVVWGLIILMSAIRITQSGTINIVFRLGKFSRVLKPGFGLIIPLLERTEVHSSQDHQDELPAAPEDIDRVNDVPMPGKKLPFRIIHPGMLEATFYVEKQPGGPAVDPDDPKSRYEKKYFKDLDPDHRKAIEADSLNAPLTSEIAVIVEWFLDGDDEDSIRNFVNNVEPTGGRNRTEEVRKRMEDMAARALQEELGDVTLGHAREKMTFFSELLKIRLEILVGELADPDTGRTERSWGIHIKDAYIKSIYPGRRINESRADAGAAVSKAQERIRVSEAEAQAAKNKAAADKFAAEQKADADAYAEKKKGEGERDRIKAMAEAMENPNARFLATLDVAEQVLPKAKMVVVPTGPMEVLGSIMALGQNMGKDTENTK